MSVDCRPPSPGGDRGRAARVRWPARRGGRLLLGMLLCGLLLVGPAVQAALSAGGAGSRQALRSLRSRDAAPGGVTWSEFAPAGWVTSLPASSSITAYAAGGLDPATAAYALSTDAGATWSPWSSAGLTVSGAVSTTQTLAVSGLSLPDSPAANQIRYRMQEVDAALETSPDYTIRIDTTPPASTVTQPANGAVLNFGPTIRGTASDAGGSGPGKIGISVRDAASGLYWSGATWTAGEQWLDAAGTDAWSYAGPQPAWVDGATCTIRSRATDHAGNQETPGSGVSFTFDVTPPAVTVAVPNGGELWAGGQPHTITWAAADTVGLPANPITLSASYDGGLSWAVLAAALPNTGSYAWATPAINSNQVLIQAEAIDRAGNRAGDRSDTTFTIDSNPPGAPQGLMASPPGWSNVASFTVTWTNPPDVSPVAGAWYKLDAPPLAASDGTFVASSNTIAGIAPASDGTHVIYVWLQDLLGRADPASAATTNLLLDRIPPSPPSGLIGSPARTWTNFNSFGESWSNPPDLSGVVGVYYRLNQPGTYPADGIFVATTSSLTGIAVPGDGKHDLYLWLVDAAGNVSHLNRNVDPQVYWFDGTSPTSTLTLTPPFPASGWYSTTVTAAFAGEDPSGGSGLDRVYHRVDESAWNTALTAEITAEGIHTVSYYARDVAGNAELAHTMMLSIDRTPPTSALVPARLPQASGWYTAPVSYNLNVTDSLSGNPRGYYRLNEGAWQSGNQVQLTTDGTYRIEYYGLDAAGNRSLGGLQEARLDAVPPATAYLIEGSQGEAGWFTSPLTVKLIATDGSSGVASTFYRVNSGPWQTGTQFPLTADGSYTLHFYSVDVAGNVETSFPVQVRLDTQAPGAPSAVETIPAGWSRVNRFTVQWANPTDLSGIAGVYYRMNQEPSSSEDGNFSPLTNRLEGLTVPGEGVHRLYLWLRDVAGNADHRVRVLAPLLRYDARPPTTTPTLQGEVGTDGWYRSAVTVTLTALDAHSGVTRLSYRLDAGTWVTTTAAQAQLVIAAPDKHVLEYGSEDAAGNGEAIQQLTLRLDPDAPASPQHLVAEPAGWQHYNSFRLTWQAPVDQSGVAGAYVRFDGPPAGPTDGTFYPGIERIEGLQVPAEGQHGIYVWLRDRAGNADHRAAVELPAALWYDATPPVTVITQTGSLGLNGWYVGPVTFDLSAADAASGVADIRYQVDDGPWISGTGFTVAAEGQHLVRVSGIDVAGNVEMAHVLAVAIDRRPPLVRMESLARYQPGPSFAVSWSGLDPSPGSGVIAYDVQVQDGYGGTWQEWLVQTPQTRATFLGQRGHTYFFRVAARDLAGNWQPFSGGNTYAVVESVLNGNFDTGNFSQWSAGGELFEAVVPVPGFNGGPILVARLGSEDYGPSLTQPGSVPVGSATISQTVLIPDLAQVPRPTLSFWYRIFTYDVAYSQRLQRVWDTFDVSLYDQAGREIALLLRDGNPTQTYKVLYDTGWKQALIDLKPYAGQTVHLAFSNLNRWDNLYNTWSYVDDVRVADWPYQYRAYLSLVTGGGGAGSSASAAEPPIAALPPAEPQIGPVGGER